MTNEEVLKELLKLFYTSDCEDNTEHVFYSYRDDVHLGDIDPKLEEAIRRLLR